MKHTETNTVKITEFVNLKYNNSKGGVFRMPKGDKPLVAIRVLNHSKAILIECKYLTSGHNIVHTGDKDVVPLKLGTFEDDNDYEITDTEEYYNETYY